MFHRVVVRRTLAILIAVAAGLAASGCGSSSRTQRVAGSSTTSTTTGRPALSPARPDAPILRLAESCTGMCAGIALPDVEFVLYADGRAIVGTTGSWAMRDVHLTDAEQTTARALAARALRGDSNVALNPGTGVADAPLETLTGWSGSTATSARFSFRQNPTIWSASPDIDRWNALTDLVALTSGQAAARGAAYQPAAVALFLRPVDAPPGQTRPWPGPPLAGFGATPRSPNGSGLLEPDLRCGVVTNDPRVNLLNSALGQDRDNVWVSDGRTFEVVIRLLVRGESTCEDAATL